MPEEGTPMNPMIQKLHEKKEKLAAEMKSLLEAELTAESEARVNAIKAEFDAADVQIAKLEAFEAASAKMQAAVQAPARKAVDATVLPRPGATSFTGGDHAGATAGAFGFRNLGEFAKVIQAASSSPNRSPADVDPRLGKLYAATLSTYGSEGVGADGGYAVPPDFRAEILKKLDGEEQLLPLTTQITTASNSVTLPADEQTPWASSGGVQAYWTSEATAITQSKPALRNVTVRAEKLAVLVPLTEEVIADASALSSWLMAKVPEVMNYKLNSAIIAGTGVGQPAGIIGAGGTVSQAAEGAQTAATVVYANVIKMYSRMRAANRKNAVWIANQEIEPQLMSMVVPAGAASTSSYPAYLPANGLSGKPFDTLLGKRVIYSEATSALGTVGDLIFADMSQYLSLVKGGGIRQDMSMHLWFDQDTMAFRFILRVGGQGWWQSTITRPGAKATFGSFVTLAAR